MSFFCKKMFAADYVITDSNRIHKFKFKYQTSKSSPKHNTNSRRVTSQHNVELLGIIELLVIYP